MRTNTTVVRRGVQLPLMLHARPEAQSTALANATVVDMALSIIKGEWLGQTRFYYTDHEWHKRAGNCGYAKEGATPHMDLARLSIRK
jgi:hypothetical protein